MFSIASCKIKSYIYCLARGYLKALFCPVRQATAASEKVFKLEMDLLDVAKKISF